ncbi:MAG: GNAT family N-acetyltransferase [Aquihabitans sp.]
MRPDEVGVVADLHRRAFPAYVSTKLGPGYCRRMLQAVARDPEAWIDLAVDDTGRVIGYLVAAPPPAQRQVERALLPWAALNAWRQPGDLFRNGRRAVLRLARRGGRNGTSSPLAEAADSAPADSAPEDTLGTSAPTEPATVRIVLVAIDSDARGRGGVDALLGAFARTAAERGHRVADLSVDTVNAAAQRAYTRNGWLPDATGAHFHLDLSGPAAP